MLKVRIIVPIAITFIGWRIHLFSSQSRIIAPKNLLFNNNAWKRGEDFAKQKADNKIKGVVGKTGRTMPIKPKASEIKPQTISNILIAFEDTSCFSNELPECYDLVT